MKQGPGIQKPPIMSMSTTRLEAFSDGVFAVAITLLVLNIHVPTPSTDPGKFVDELKASIPAVLVYVLSFVIVGIYWVGHHNTFHYIQRTDRILLWLNIFLLLCIVFIPFPTALLGLTALSGASAPISVTIYGCTLILTGSLLQLLWWYATKNYRLVDRNIDPQLVRRAARRNVMGPMIYFLAIMASFLHIVISLSIFALVPLLYILPGNIDRHWKHVHEPGSPEKHEAKAVQME